MYDSVATLKGVPVSTYDDYGNEVITYTDKTVYVQPRGVYNSEFYNAAQLGLHPSVTFQMANKADYSGEKLIEWEGKQYDVIRVDWNAQRDSISLICEERIGKYVAPPPTPPAPDPDDSGEEEQDEGDDNGQDG